MNIRELEQELVRLKSEENRLWKELKKAEEEHQPIIDAATKAWLDTREQVEKLNIRWQVMSEMAAENQKP